LTKHFQSLGGRFLVPSFTGTTFETVQEIEAESQILIEEQRINVIEKDPVFPVFKTYSKC